MFSTTSRLGLGCKERRRRCIKGPSKLGRISECKPSGSERNQHYVVELYAVQDLQLDLRRTSTLLGAERSSPDIPRRRPSAPQATRLNGDAGPCRSHECQIVRAKLRCPRETVGQRR